MPTQQQRREAAQASAGPRVSTAEARTAFKELMGDDGFSTDNLGMARRYMQVLRYFDQQEPSTPPGGT